MREDLCYCLKEILELKGLTFYEVSQLTGSSKTQINNIINHNGREVSLEKIISIIQKLNFKVEITVEEES